MKGKLFLIIFFILTSQSFCQLKFIGINFSPSLTIPSNPEYDFFEGYVNYSFGLNGLYYLNDKTFISTGINYVQKGYYIKDIIDTRGASSDIFTKPFSDLKDLLILRKHFTSFSKLDILIMFQSITIPVILNYEFYVKRKKAFSFSAGFEAGYLFNAKGDINSKNDFTWNDKMDNMTASLCFGLGWSRSLSDKFTLMLSPKYSYNFYPAYSGIKVNFQTISLELNLLYSVK